MKILGIDPGLATVGYGVIEKDSDVHYVECGCITTPAGTDLTFRLSLIAKDLNELIAFHKPEILAIEEIFFNKNVKTGILVAQARGVILHEAFKKGLTIFEYNPLQIKLAVTGDGGADKLQVQTMVQKIFDLPDIPRPDDAADAVAVALTRAYQTACF